MKTKILYALVSSHDDVYLEQAHISICSAKYQMPDCHVVLLVDEKTDSLMDDNRRKILKNVDEYVVISIDENVNAQQRSRLVKCGARNYVKGDFLYIDTDTIIAQPLYEIDDVPYSVAATRDSHCAFSENPYREMDIALSNAIGFSVEKEPMFFNGGVIFAKDDEIAHQFYNMWQDEWKAGRKYGVTKDQPALQKANSQLGHVVKQIDDVWNVEFIHGMHYMKDAKIVHYLATNAKGGVQPYILKSTSAYDLLKEDLDNINDEFYMKLIRDPFTGINELTTIIAGEEVYLRRTWLYSVILDWYIKGDKFNKVQSFLMKLVALKQKLTIRRD